jgi:hypothetical protein
VAEAKHPVINAGHAEQVTAGQPAESRWLSYDVVLESLVGTVGID